MDEVSKAQLAVIPRLPDGRWPKGVSGNPRGRPPGPNPATEMYKEIYADPDVRERVKQEIIRTMTSKGMAGVLERREAAERVEGKVVQQVAMDIHATLTLEEVLAAKQRATA